MDEVAFHNECLRKEKLLDLFEKIETENLKALKKYRGHKIGRVINDWARVVKIQPASLVLHRSQGEKIKPVIVSREITDLIRLGDDLFLTAELLNKQWRILSVQMIGNQLGPQAN